MKIWKKYSSSGIYKTRYQNDSYLLLLGKRKLQSFKISFEKFLLIWNKHHSLLSGSPPISAAPESLKINKLLGHLLEEIRYLHTTAFSQVCYYLSVPFFLQSAGKDLRL